MRRLATRGLQIALLVGLSSGVAFAGENDARDKEAKPGAKESISSKGMFSQWFGPKEKDAKPKSKSADAKTKEPVVKEPSPRELAALAVRESSAERAREEKTLLRRLAVCDRLMEIAIRTNDQELIRRVEQLDERARKAYSERTAHLAATGVSFSSDEDTLEKYLGTASTSSAGTAGSGKASVSAKDRGGRAAVKEGTP